MGSTVSVRLGRLHNRTRGIPTSPDRPSLVLHRLGLSARGRPRVSGGEVPTARWPDKPRPLTSVVGTYRIMSGVERACSAGEQRAAATDHIATSIEVVNISARGAALAAAELSGTSDWLRELVLRITL